MIIFILWDFLSYVYTSSGIMEALLSTGDSGCYQKTIVVSVVVEEFVKKCRITLPVSWQLTNTASSEICNLCGNNQTSLQGQTQHNWSLMVLRPKQKHSGNHQCLICQMNCNSSYCHQTFLERRQQKKNTETIGQMRGGRNCKRERKGEIGTYSICFLALSCKIFRFSFGRGKQITPPTELYFT